MCSSIKIGFFSRQTRLLTANNFQHSNRQHRQSKKNLYNQIVFKRNSRQTIFRVREKEIENKQNGKKILVFLSFLSLMHHLYICLAMSSENEKKIKNPDSSNAGEFFSQSIYMCIATKMGLSCKCLFLVEVFSAVCFVDWHFSLVRQNI